VKQVFLGSPGIIVREVPAPEPVAGRLLVHTRHSLISAGTEGSTLKGRSRAEMRAEPGPAPAEEKMTALGYSAAGEVIDAGGLDEFVAGGLAACAGSGANHAEIISVPRNLAAPAPEGVPSASAAFTTLGSIALQGIRRADPRLGETVVVVGLGLVGQLAAQLLAAAGCVTVGIDVQPERVALACSLGLDLGLTAGEDDVVPEVLRITGGHGADAAILCAYAPENDELANDAFKYTRRRGRVVVVGSVGMGLRRPDFYRREQDFLISCSYGPGRYDPAYEEQGQDYPYEFVRWTENRNMREVLRLLAAGKLRVEPLTSASFPIAQARRAYEEVVWGGANTIGVLLEY